MPQLPAPPLARRPEPTGRRVGHTARLPAPLPARRTELTRRRVEPTARREGGPGFDFNPEGFCLPIDAECNIGMVEKWKNGYKRRMMF